MRLERRQFLAAFGGAAILWPIAAGGQQGLPRVGILDPGLAHLFAAFFVGMRDAGYVEGQNIAYVRRVSEGRPETLRELAVELVRADVDVIVTDGTPATRAAQAATGTIPIVFAIGANPVQQGFVTSLARPNANVTGFMFGAHTAKQLQILKEALPAASVVALPSGEYPELAETASSIGVRLNDIAVKSPDDLRSFFESVRTSRADAVLFPNIAWSGPHQRTIGAAALENRVPLIGTWRPFAESGALLAYGPTPLVYRARLAAQVGRILKGAEIPDIPVEQTTKFDLVINLKTAKALGITIPQPLLQRADEVIQ